MDIEIIEKRNRDYFFIFLLFISLNLLIFRYIFNPKYRFFSGFPYFFDPDSYYYISFYSIKWAYLISILVSFASILLFYKINEKYTKKPFLSTLFIITFPYFLNKMFFFYFDSQKIVIFILLGMFISILRLNRHIIIKIAIFALLWAVLFVTWTGRPIIEIMLLFGLIFALSFMRKYWLILVLFSILGIFVFFSRFQELIFFKGLGVAEYATPLYFGYYAVALIVIWHYFNNKEKLFETRFLFGCFIFSFILSLFIGRFSLFAIIIMGLLLSKLNFYENNTKIVYCFIILNIVLMIISYSGTVPPMDREKEDMLTNCLNESIPVLAFWDNGHIISYFSGNDVVMRANPGNMSEMFKKSIINSNISLFDEMGGDNYYLYLEWTDVFKIKDAFYKNTFIHKLKENKEIDGFKLICSTEDYSVLERKR